MAGGFCPEVMPARDEIEHNKGLSTRLYRMMENTGVTTEVRDIRIEANSLYEILQSIVYEPNIFLYIFGSRYENTFPYEDKETDVDMVFIHKNMPVATNIYNCPHPICYLLLPDKQQGYFMLQLILDGKPITNYWYMYNTYRFDAIFMHKHDKYQRLCLIQKLVSMLQTNGYMQGPAYRFSKNIAMPADLVYALKGEDWPDCATEWLTRQRDNGWPSEDLIMKCKTLGFFMVYTGHPASNEKELQWRISFSLQERLLVTQFNSVQLKCYVLLKRIKKEIQAQVKEETLTSYHFKTCMLYMLENTPSELWIPENLFTCVLMCLQQLLIYVRNNNCPNYFIPGENMFDRITSGQLREKVGKVLERMLNFQANLFDCLIQSNSYLFAEAEQNIPFKFFIAYAIQLEAKIGAVGSLFRSKLSILRGCYEKSLTGFKYNLTDKLRQVEKATTITEHTKAETDQAKSLILPFLRVHLLSCNLVFALSAGTQAAQKILTSKEWEQQAPIAGYSKLKQAAAMLMLRHYERAIDVLLSICDIKKFSCCNCNPAKPFSPSPQEQLKAVGFRPHISVTDLQNEFVQPCVIFLPLEQKITATALQYEMVRDFGIPPPSSERFTYCWRNWGVVDGNFLLHFLLHLNYQALEKNSKAIYHVKKMIYLLNNKTVSHRETCYNLLGWVHKERRAVPRAVQCFSKSLETASQHNAACWHLCFLICGF